MQRPTVVLEDERPAGKGSGKCFFCQENIGQLHGEHCPLWKKRIVVRASVEYEIEVPHHWVGKDVEFHRNEGTWCADNLIGELQNQDLRRLSLRGACLCGMVHTEFVRDVEEES